MSTQKPAENTDNYEITVTNVEPRTLLVAKGQTTFEELPVTIGALLGDVWDYIKANGIEAGLSVVVYPGESGKLLMCTEEGAVIEAGAEFVAASEGSAEEESENDAGDVTVLPNGLSLSSTPGGLVASAIHWGAYDQITQAHIAIQEWCRANQRGIQGTNWEVYGHWTNDPAKLRTDIFYLLEKA